jgi:hypothetical protein
MPRIVDLGITKYVWVTGATGIANVNAPVVTEITGGVDISSFVVTTTHVAPTASDTTNEKSITDTSNVVVPTIGNYEGNLVLFRDYTSGAPTASVDLLATFSASGIVGYIVRRVGKASATAVATADKVDVFKFMTDSPQVMGGTGEGYLKLTVPLLQQGAFSTGVAVVAS